MSLTCINCFFLPKIRNASMIPWTLNNQYMFYYMIIMCKRAPTSVYLHTKLKVCPHSSSTTHQMGGNLNRYNNQITWSYLEICVRIPSIIHAHYFSVHWIRNSFLGGGSFMILGPPPYVVSDGGEFVEMVPIFLSDLHHWKRIPDISHCTLVYQVGFLFERSLQFSSIYRQT